MRKAKNDTLSNVIYYFIVVIALLGFEKGVQLFMEVMSIFNSILVEYFDSNILEVTLKHIITYSIVGIIFSIISCPRGKTGHTIGRIFYFIVGFVVSTLLGLLSRLIF